MQLPSLPRVLVTGASGFIGRILCRELTSRGWTVAALLRSPQSGPWHEVVQAELGHGPLDPGLLTGVDTIFHLAGKAHVRARTARDIAQYETVHVHGTRHLLEAARAAGVRCCVLVSSVKAMGEGGADIWDESTPCRPQTPYGRTKLMAERLVLDELPLPCPVVLRPAMVYGPGAKGNLALLIRAIGSGLFPHIDFPRNQRSMIHVHDVVQACMLAATHPAACGRTYILTDGHDWSTGEILELIRQTLKKPSRWTLPYGVLSAAAKLGDTLTGLGLPCPIANIVDKLAGSARYSNARICRELDFAPGHDLVRGIREMAGP